MRYAQADFDDLAAVEELACGILHGTHGTHGIDVLINIAGRPGAAQSRLSHDGNEATLQTNYLSPVLLTDRLMPALLARAGRVVNIASSTHLSASLDPADLNMEHSPYDATTAYARTKLALAAHAKWLTQQTPPRVDAVSLHPGIIKTALLHAMFSIDGDPARLGARNVVGAALAREPWAGQYLDQDRPARPNPLALDADFRSRLRESTETLLGTAPPAGR